MVAPNTGSLIGPNSADSAFGNRTGTAVSTNIIIEVNGVAVGAVKSFSINEARTITQIDEVGTDGHIDSVPSKSVNITGSCQRTRFDNLRMAPAFSRGFIHVGAQRIPFDIVVKDIFAGNDPNSTLVTTIKNVWISKLAVTFRSDDFVIVSDMDWEAETIFTTLGSGSGNAVPSLAGGRSIVPENIDSIEQATDVGQRRGALDAAGLLNAIDSIA